MDKKKRGKKIVIIGIVLVILSSSLILFKEVIYDIIISRFYFPHYHYQIYFFGVMIPIMVGGILLISIGIYLFIDKTRFVKFIERREGKKHYKIVKIGALVLCLIGGIISLVTSIRFPISFGAPWYYLFLIFQTAGLFVAGVVGMVGAVVGLLWKKAGSIICIGGGLIGFFVSLYYLIFWFVWGLIYIPTWFILIGGMVSLRFSSRVENN